MKRFISLILLCVLSLFCLFGCNEPNDSSSSQSDSQSSSQSDSGQAKTINELEKHLLLNSDSSYGYGDAKNGAFDIVDEMYNIINYYERGSTKTRTLLYNYKPYQKTYDNTDGIACILSLLNYFGYDTANEYTEKNLKEMYEEVNRTSLDTNEETTEGLTNLLDQIGITYVYGEDGSNSAPTDSKKCYDFFKGYLSQGKAVLVPLNDGTKGYVLCIGCDGMGTNTYYDDLLIFMDPNDILDHYQDGFYVEASTAFHTWWNITRENGSSYKIRDFIAITPPSSFDIQNAIKIREDFSIANLTHNANHLLIQPDGKYLSSYYTNKFNGLPHNKDGITDGGSTANYSSWTQQKYHHEDSYYYARPDFYNMESDELNGKYIIKNWRSHVQNMGSTCGICALTNIMNYLGFDTMGESSIYDEATVASDYEQINSAEIQGVGTGIPNFKNLFNNTKYSSILDVLTINKSTGVGTKSTSTASATLTYTTYDSFASSIKDYIKNGHPMAVSWKPCHGHWTVIIGFYDYNNTNPYDDVIVMGDSSDYRDHYFDGYDIVPAMTFFNRWTNTAQTVLQAHFVVDKKAS